MRRVVSIASLLVLLILIGTIGLRIIEGSSWLDSLFMAVITLTTVGFEDVVGLSPLGKMFVIVYLVMGLGMFTYSAFQLGHWIASDQMRSLWEKRRMLKKINALENHFIVCGMGRMGETICHYLSERGKQFLVIDVDAERLAEVCEELGWLYIHGDATDDEVLQSAGVTRARSLASVLPTDADNVYVVLSARIMSAELKIIARAGDEKAASKMERAGATRVISPLSTGAVKIARFMLNPSIEDFLEIADEHGNELELADVQITENSVYAGKTLMETDLRDRGVMVIGIRRKNGERLMPPPGSSVIQPGDSLFAFGSVAAVNAMIGEGES
jgi:voltage-gated potassium channel